MNILLRTAVCTLALLTGAAFAEPGHGERRQDADRQQDSRDMPADARALDRARIANASSGDTRTAPHVDAPRADAPRADAPRADAPRVNGPHVDAPRADAPRVDAPRVEPPRFGTPHVDPPRGAVSRENNPSAPSRDVPRTEWHNGADRRGNDVAYNSPRRDDRRDDRRDERPGDHHDDSRNDGYRDARRRGWRYEPDWYRGYRNQHFHFDRGRYFGRQRFSIGLYLVPRGYRYRLWSAGEYLPYSYYDGGRYEIYDYWRYDLYEPPYRATWVRVGDDALLIDVESYEVIDAVYGLFF